MSCKTCEDTLPRLYISVDEEPAPFRYNPKQLGCANSSGFQTENGSPFKNAPVVYTANSALETPAFSSNPLITEMYFTDNSEGKLLNSEFKCS